MSTLLVKFELIQKHNKLFVYTLTTHFSSSAASLCAGEPFLFFSLCFFLLSFRFTNDDRRESSVLVGLCVECVFVIIIIILYVSLFRTLLLFSFSLITCFFPSAYWIVASFKSCVASAFRPCVCARARFSLSLTAVECLFHWRSMCAQRHLVARASTYLRAVYSVAWNYIYRGAQALYSYLVCWTNWEYMHAAAAAQTPIWYWSFRLLRFDGVAFRFIREHSIPIWLFDFFRCSNDGVGVQTHLSHRFFMPNECYYSSYGL